MVEIGRRSRGAWWLAATLAVGCAEDPDGWEGFAGGSSESGDATSEPDDHDDDSGADGGAETTGRDSPGTGGEADATGSTGDAADDPPGDGGTTEPAQSGRVRVHPGDTSDAELVETLPVGKSEDAAARKVVLRLQPSELPDLLAGDLLITPAEVQATTRCDIGQTAAGCNYDPKIRAQIILTGDADDDDPAGPESRALTDVQTQTCTKNEHHCMFVFRPAHATNVIEGGLELPCVAAGNCRVNVVMWAWDSQARAGGQDKVLVGGNDGNYLDNGIVDGDQARLMVIRERKIGAGDRHERETTGGGNVNVATNAEPVLVYSHKLTAGDGNLKAGEQFIVEAKIAATVGGRARFSSQMFLTKSSNAAEGSGLEKVSPKAIGEHNGINCLPGQNPCVTRKVAVFRVTEDISGPVYVNIFVKSAVPGGGSTSVTVHRNDGWLRSTRYEAQHEG